MSDFFDDIEEESIAMTDDTGYMDVTIQQSMDDWFENSRYSPKKFHYNTFVGTEGKDFAGQLLYDFDLVYSPDNENGNAVYLCVASLKSSPYIIEDIRATDEDKQTDELILYGHSEDKDDEFSSRFDKKLCNKIGSLFKSRFRFVRMAGAFESLESLNDIIDMVHERMLRPDGMIRIYLDSKVPDDEGNIHTIANLVNSGYIDRNINPKYMIEYVYKKFDRRLTAYLYTKEYVKPKTVLFDGTEGDN